MESRKQRRKSKRRADKKRARLQTRPHTNPTPTDGGLVEDWTDCPTLVHFFLPLPFVLPAVHGSTIRIENSELLEWLRGVVVTPTSDFENAVVRSEGNAFVSIRFFQYTETVMPSIDLLKASSDAAREFIPGVSTKLGSLKKVPRIPLNKNGNEEFYTTTVLECVTPLEVYSSTEDDTISVGSSLKMALSRAVSAVQEMLRAYRVYSLDLNASAVNFTTLYPLVLFTSRSLGREKGERWASGLGLIRINEGDSHFIRPKIVVEHEDFSQIMTALSRDRKGDALIVASEFSWKAHRALEIEGDLQVAVLHAQTSSELMLDSVLLSLAWESGKSPSETAQWFAASDRITRRVSRWYSEMLPGNWNCTDPNGVVGRWAKALCHLRNRIAHAGYFPTEEEARQAVGSADDLVDFVIDRLLQRRNAYPRTLLLLAGIPGLTRRGEFSKKLRQFIEEQANTEPDWIIEKARWVEEFKSERNRSATNEE